MRVHFIGAGGVGVAGLAHIAADLGWTVTGSDAAPSPMLETLRARGLAVTAPHGDAVPGEPDAVVYSSAIGADNAELADARRRGLRCVRRGEFLGEMARAFRTVVAVAGSHGKTSTTAMLAHICREAGLAPGFLVGGQVNGWPRAAAAGDGSLLVTEVDESDGTQVFTAASLAVVVNVEDDHCWSHGGVARLQDCFVQFARRAGRVLAWESPTVARLFGGWPTVRLAGPADAPAGLAVPQPGAHNRTDATLALLAAEWLGVPEATALAALATFPGVSRRLSVRQRSADGRRLLVEDYAHHPTELEATLAALRESRPGVPLLVVFQPHRHERVRRYGRRFSELLGAYAERVWVMAPFAAWTAGGAERAAAAIAGDIPGGRGVYVDGGPEAVAASVRAELARRGEAAYTLAVIGAGDVTRVVPLVRLP